MCQRIEKRNERVYTRDYKRNFCFVFPAYSTRATRASSAESTPSWAGSWTARYLVYNNMPIIVETVINFRTTYCSDGTAITPKHHYTMQTASRISTIAYILFWVTSNCNRVGKDGRIALGSRKIFENTFSFLTN